MGCTGCNHGNFLTSDELSKLLPGYDPDDLLPPDVEVNSVNPGVVGPVDPGAVDKGYDVPPDTPPLWTIDEDDSGTEKPRRVEIFLASFWAFGWHGECGVSSSGCEEVESCMLRLTLRFYITVSHADTPGEKPSLPEMPSIGVNSTAPSEVVGEPTQGLRYPGQPKPDPLPPDQVGPVTQERGNPLPEVPSSPGFAGTVYYPDGTSRSFRRYTVEAVYKSVPGCGVTHEFEIELDDWTVDIDGEESGSSGSNWDNTSTPDSDKNIDVRFSCTACQVKRSQQDDRPITPGGEPNISTNSIGNG